MLVIPLLSLVVLIILSAFFSGSETALIGSSRVKLNHLVDQGNKNATRALKLLQDPSEMLGTILVGNNLVNVMAAALATTLIGPVYATLVITLLLLVFAEITPKTIAAGEPERISALIALPVQVFTVLLKPLVWATTTLTDWLMSVILHGRLAVQRHFSRQELITALKMGASDGELEPAETRMTEEVLGLKDKPVSKIMITLDEVEAIPETATFEEVLVEFVRSGFTRYPVYRGFKSEMIGLLLVKDLLIQNEEMRENWLYLVRPLMRCKPELEADELLRDMQIRHSHLVAVEDEKGRSIGMVTMEDVLEEIVGEIQDETDSDGDLIREFSPDRFAVRGDAEVDDLCKVINIDLGKRDQHMTLAKWFEKRVQPGRGKVRRVKFGNAQVVLRGVNRFEIWVKVDPEQEGGASADS